MRTRIAYRFLDTLTVACMSAGIVGMLGGAGSLLAGWTFGTLIGVTMFIVGVAGMMIFEPITERLRDLLRVQREAALPKPAPRPRTMTRFDVDDRFDEMMKTEWPYAK